MRLASAFSAGKVTQQRLATLSSRNPYLQQLDCGCSTKLLNGGCSSLMGSPLHLPAPPWVPCTVVLRTKGSAPGTALRFTANITQQCFIANIAQQRFAANITQHCALPPTQRAREPFTACCASPLVQQLHTQPRIQACVCTCGEQWAAGVKVVRVEAGGGEGWVDGGCVCARVCLRALARAGSYPVRRHVRMLSRPGGVVKRNMPAVRCVNHGRVKVN
jgi:hypothetical protein